MSTVRTMFQNTTFSIPAMQNMIARFKEILGDNPAIAAKAKNVFQTVMDVKQQSASHTPTLTDGETQLEKVETHQASRYPNKGTNFLGKLMGPAGLFLLNALSAEGMPAGLIIKSGSTGGLDLCDDTYWCIQATINNASTDEVLAQACRKISITGAGGSQFTETALSSEFDKKAFEQVLSSFLDAAPDWYTNRTTKCTAQAGIWSGTQITGTATHLSTEGCGQFESFFNDAANDAANWRTSAKAFGMYLGVVAATVLVVACCYCACLCALDDDCRKSISP